MRFLKAIRKSGEQKPEEKKPAGRVFSAPDEGKKFSRLVPGLVRDADIRIGADSASLNSEIDAHKSNGGQISSAMDRGNISLNSFASFYIEKEKVNRHLVAVTDPDSAVCEEYRNLRATLLQKSKKQKLKTVAVVSAMPSEGKSITALNLAWLIAQTKGVTGLVVDGDLRVPSLSKYLGVESGSGLSDVLDGAVELDEAIVRLAPSGLHLLPGGMSKPDIAEQFSSPKFAEFLGRVEGLFDYIVIDAPPLSVFAEAKVLMNQADTSIVVVRSNYTKYADVGRVLEGLSGQRILGVVLNRSDETLISGKYYDHQYYQNYKNSI